MGGTGGEDGGVGVVRMWDGVDAGWGRWAEVEGLGEGIRMGCGGRWLLQGGL